MKKYIGLLMAWFLLLGCLCLAACTAERTTSSEPETPATTTATTPTTVDPTTLSIFDPERYRYSTIMSACMDGAYFDNGGICMEHHHAAAVGSVFIWVAEEDMTMPDFPSPENSEEWSRRHDCLRGGLGLDHETHPVLFCEGVPNLGDYLMYRMTECPAVYIPDSVQSIGEHTFPENTAMVIHCHAGSFAEQYAKAHGMAYEIERETVDTMPTTIKRTERGLFDPERYRNTHRIGCFDTLSFEDGGICMEHYNDRIPAISEGQTSVFVWRGAEGVTMPDFTAEREEDTRQRQSCLRDLPEIDGGMNAILFCEGVPNLGDYLMYNLPDCPAVYIPDSVQSIGEHTFPENTAMVIHCHAGSYAEQYAKAHGMAYEIERETVDTMPTTIKRTERGLFDPLRYENADMAKCMDYATFEYGGLCMEHRVSFDDRVADDEYVVFIWIGEAGVTMPDYVLPTASEEWSIRRDCLQGGHGTDIETRTILFCEGVPNLGDYLMYNLPDCPAVYIPDSVQSIGEHTFAENAITVIHCHAGSYAEQYAKSHGMKCEIVTE